MPAVPNRGTSEQALDQFNIQMRSSPLYQDFLRRNGFAPGSPVRMSRGQQEALERELQRAGFTIPGGMHIDQGGNLNQNNRLVRNTAIAAGIAAGGYMAAPAIAGALAGSGAAGAGAAGAAGTGAAGAAGAGAAGAAGAGAAGAAGAGAAGAGGWGAAAIPALTTTGRLLSGAAQGSANQRALENQQTQSGNSLLAQLHNTRQGATMDAARATSDERMDHANLDLNRRQFALNAPRTRASQSVRGSILQNAQPFQLSGLPSRVSSRIPTMTGGLTPAMFNADTRALGGEMTRSALIDQLKGDQFEPMKETDFSAAILANPELQELQRSGLLEQIMGGLGLAASVAGGVGGAVNNGRGARTPPINYGLSPYEDD